MSKINSHIQMPKCVLKEFKNDMNAIFCYNVENRFISKTSARYINTKPDYYSEEVEQFLNRTIESKFADLIKKIKDTDFKNSYFVVDEEMDKTIKEFLCFLMLRAPKMKEMLSDKNSLYSLLSENEKNDINVLFGYLALVDNNSFSKYYTTFTVNESETPFVLHVNGLVPLTVNAEEERILLPITPNIAITLMNETCYKKHTDKNDISDYFNINDSTIIKEINELAFGIQCKLKWGYVVCPEKKELERLKIWWDNNERQIFTMAAGTTTQANTPLVLTTTSFDGVKLAAEHKDTLTFKVNVASAAPTFASAEIAGKTWMTENLKLVPEGATWEDDGIYVADSGEVYYNWEAAQTACPEGWTLPTKTDLESLAALYDKDTIMTGPFKGARAGYVYGGELYAVGYYGLYWSNAEDGDYDAYVLNFSNDGVSVNGDDKADGSSVRCVAE